MDNETVATIIATVAGGGLAGGIISVISSNWLRKKELAIKIIGEYSGMFTEISEVYGFIRDKWCYRFDDISMDAPEDQLRERTTRIERYEKILLVGNWFDLVAHLFIFNDINYRIVKNLGLIDEISTFGQLLNENGFELIDYDGATREWGEGWYYIKKLDP